MALPKPLPRARQVSEKTLELNVCAELLALIRKRHPKAVWLGLTQLQEQGWGIDEMLRNAGPGFHLMLQFKSPWPTSREDGEYRFSINTQQQMAIMAGPAALSPDSVWYVLPHFSTWPKVEAMAPTLVEDTWALKASDVQSAGWASKPERHKVIAQTGSRKAKPNIQIRSPQFDVVVSPMSEILVPRQGEINVGESWLPAVALREWFNSRVEVAGQVGLARVLDLRWRGLNSLFIPTSS